VSLQSRAPASEIFHECDVFLDVPRMIQHWCHTYLSGLNIGRHAREGSGFRFEFWGLGFEFWVLGSGFGGLGLGLGFGVSGFGVGL